MGTAWWAVYGSWDGVGDVRIAAFLVAIAAGSFRLLGTCGKGA